MNCPFGQCFVRPIQFAAGDIGFYLFCDALDQQLLRFNCRSTRSVNVQRPAQALGTFPYVRARQRAVRQ